MISTKIEIPINELPSPLDEMPSELRLFVETENSCSKFDTSWPELSQIFIIPDPSLDGVI